MPDNAIGVYDLLLSLFRAAVRKIIMSLLPLSSASRAFTFCSLIFFATTAAATDDPVLPKPDDKDAVKVDVPAPPSAITHHRLTIDGKTIAYTATAATIDMKNDAGDAIGRMFYVAYTADGAGADHRPVTFCFNGGPGSSSLWLHMASFGPVRTEVSDAQPTPPPPYTVTDNPESLLDKTDLIFVDAMGTGFSRVLSKGKGEDFYGTDADIADGADQCWKGNACGQACHDHRR